MTGAATVSRRDDDFGELPLPSLRWGVGFLLIAGLHLGAGWFALHWASPLALPSAPPPGAVMIDFAPLPAAPSAPPTAMPPGPQQTLSSPRPPEPEVRQPLPAALPSPAPRIAVPLPPKPKRKPAEHHPAHDHPMAETPAAADMPPAPATTAPPQVQAPPARMAASPAAGTASTPPSTAAPTWRGLLLGRLEQSKRYPPLAQVRRQQGVAYLRFAMDRDGNVLSAQIEKSSGYDLLDDETLAMIRRAEPLPKPPPEVPGDRIELVVPVQFFLRDRE